MNQTCADPGFPPRSKGPHRWIGDGRSGDRGVGRLYLGGCPIAGGLGLGQGGGHQRLSPGEAHGHHQGQAGHKGEAQNKQGKDLAGGKGAIVGI